MLVFRYSFLTHQVRWILITIVANDPQVVILKQYGSLEPISEQKSERVVRVESRRKEDFAIRTSLSIIWTIGLYKVFLPMPKLGHLQTIQFAPPLAYFERENCHRRVPITSPLTRFVRLITTKFLKFVKNIGF